MRRSSTNRADQVAGRRPLGQALVEFALVLPVFLLIVFGIIDVGRYVYVNNAFNQAAREAARYGSVEQWSYSCPASVPVASQNRFTCTAAVAINRIAAAPAFSAAAVTCTTDGSNSVAASACRAGYLLKVTVATPSSPANQRFQFFTPVIGQILGSPVITGQASVVVQ